ncbi:hypothetical protein M404DRAFT_32602 [Pisolithus tinctorius Marx 270]|uniref:Uncharacterized protein n=1 Tax=Pisolithus tinctorius Marx 270 TaxID=870435 RepID=A0A0C3NNC3_PISTI|nr:hypothetical protein M404DRAFT_32602 [Pisolithus tinctorius Marx 270]
MSYTPNTNNPGSDYFNNDFHANINEPYDPSHPHFDRYASTPPCFSEPPVHSPSPMVSSHSTHGGAYQPLHDSVASAMRPYPYLVIHLVPSLQRTCKDARKGKSKAHSGPSKPCYDASFWSCNTPPLSQAGYRSPSPAARPGASTPAPSVSPADLSAPAAAPAAPATSTSKLAPEASLFLGYVWLLNHFKHWESHGWRAGEHHNHLRMLSTIFRSSEVVGKHMYNQVGTVEGSFEAHTYEAIDCSSSSVLQEALKTQEAIVKIVHEDYGPSLISSFHSFLNGLPINVVVHGLFPPAIRKVEDEEAGRRTTSQHGEGGTREVDRDVKLRCRDCWEKITLGQGREHFQAIMDALTAIPFNSTPCNWLDLFTQAQGGSAGRALFHTFQTTRALPATPFVPVPISALSKREFGGLVPVDWQHPLHQFACY